jgi:magnesium-transporting ATPase (P-type)
MRPRNDGTSVTFSEPAPAQIAAQLQSLRLRSEAKRNDAASHLTVVVTGATLGAMSASQVSEFVEGSSRADAVVACRLTPTQVRGGGVRVR